MQHKVEMSRKHKSVNNKTGNRQVLISQQYRQLKHGEYENLISSPSSNLLIKGVTDTHGEQDSFPL